jgi:hypothetical protein
LISAVHRLDRTPVLDRAADNAVLNLRGRGSHILITTLRGLGACCVNGRGVTARASLGRQAPQRALSVILTRVGLRRSGCRR